MDKIEKLKKFKYKDWDIVQKVNELVEAYNQSQKQPEGWVDYVNKHYKEWKKHKEEFDKRAEEQLERFKYKTEKQEEWREELERIIGNTITIFCIDTGEEGFEDSLNVGVSELIDQLLSERTIDRSKLRLIRLYLMNYRNVEKWKSIPKGAKEPLDELIEYLSKLLKERE